MEALTVKQQERRAAVVAECQFDLATIFNSRAINIIAFHGARIDLNLKQMQELLAKAAN